MAIGAHNSLKRGPLSLGDKIGGRCVDSEFMLTLKLRKNEIMFMHMLARRYIAGGKADNLTVFSHRVILGDNRSSDFMAERNCIRHI